MVMTVPLFFLAACDRSADMASRDTANETADDFAERVNEELGTLARELAAADWVRSTYITEDTGLIAAKANERVLGYLSNAVEQSKQFDGAEASPEARRAIKVLRLQTPNPAPNDEAKRAELAGITTRMEGIYGAGKYCPDGESSCMDLTALEEIIDTSRDYDALTEAWLGWRTVSPQMRGDYERFVELANEGARELGFMDLGEMWRAGYDMSPDAFAQETERLWSQVAPLYEALHCYVRDRLADYYGEDRVSRDGPIPAHILGNMWAQQWANIYELVEPFPGVADLDVTAALDEQGYEPVRMTRSAEEFYVSIGFPELPETFWERSMLSKPTDREVVCHASAWHMDGYEDVRIKQCIKPTQEQLLTIYHELGHVYYYLWYKDQPNLFQNGAHDGFHEAVGDTVNLSMTPAYMQSINLVGDLSSGDDALINQQMKLALDKIAFLPFGKLIDQWRWRVFAGEIKPDEYNAAWWDLRKTYQGVAPPRDRSESDFDPAAKYHIPANTPYTRYFLSFILQFQFHRALCELAGHEGALHECSIYGNEEAGQAFGEMLALGASQPWQDTLEKLTGTREMDASAIIDYFQPLMGWLEEQNEGRSCGW